MNYEFKLGDKLTHVSTADKPWTRHRKNADLVQDIYANSNIYSKYALRIGDCAQWLLFREFTADDLAEHDRKIKLKKAHFCRVRHCPVCAWRRTLALLARFHEHLPEYLAEFPDYDYIVLVLTVKNPPMDDLRLTIQAMNKAFKRLVRRDEVLKICKGFVKAVEVTMGRDGNPHPHFHVTIAVNKSYFKKDYINQQRWVELWQECLKVDYVPVVHAKKAYVKKSLRENRDVTSADRISAALVETVKYSTKESDLITDPEFLLGLTEQVFRLRFISTGGCLKGILSKCAKLDEPDEVSEDEMMLQNDESDQASGDELLFQWNRKNYILTGIEKAKKD